MDWTKVEDKLPSDDRKVWVCLDIGYGDSYWVGYYYEDEQEDLGYSPGWIVPNQGIFGRVTHWADIVGIDNKFKYRRNEG